MPSWVQTKRSNTAASAPAPTDILEGQLAVNLADRQLYSKNASGVIIPIGARVSVGATAPTSPSTGDLWYEDTVDGRTFIWDGAQWVDAAPVESTRTITAGPYADSTAAKAAGLNVKDMYYTATGDVKVVV